MARWGRSFICKNWRRQSWEPPSKTVPGNESWWWALLIQEGNTNCPVLGWTLVKDCKGKSLRVPMYMLILSPVFPKYCHFKEASAPSCNGRSQVGIPSHGSTGEGGRSQVGIPSHRSTGEGGSDSRQVYYYRHFRRGELSPRLSSGSSPRVWMS